MDYVCSHCPVRSGCLKICDLVENVIPSMEKGRVDAEDLPRLYMGIRTVNVLLENTHLLTDRRQQVIQLYYRETVATGECPTPESHPTGCGRCPGPCPSGCGKTLWQCELARNSALELIWRLFQVNDLISASFP